MTMTAERTPIDIAAITRSINLVEFAGQYTQLRQISRQGEFADPPLVARVKRIN